MFLNLFVVGCALARRHVSRQKCLCVFQHSDFVTAVAFHPIVSSSRSCVLLLCCVPVAESACPACFCAQEDRYFVSGSFDKKLRIWNIPGQLAASPCLVSRVADGSRVCVYFAEHRVVEWAQTANIITAATFAPNGELRSSVSVRLLTMPLLGLLSVAGQMAVAGLYNGQCVFYQTEARLDLTSLILVLTSAVLCSVF